MAILAPLLRRKRVLAARIEGTPGTAVDLSAAYAAFNVFDGTIQTTTEMEERLQQGGFGRLPDVPAGRQGQATFSLELTAGQATPPWAQVFLAACGLGLNPESGTTTTPGSNAIFMLDSRPPGATDSSQKTLTIGMFEDGIFKQLHGCMGNAVFTFTAGKKVMIAFTFTGVWSTPTDVAILSPSYPTTPPLRFVSSSLLIGAWTPVVAEMTLDLGNEVYLREDSTQGSGFSHAVIANRRPNGSINPEASLIANKDAYGDWLAGTEAALSFQCSAGLSTAAFAASGCQFLNPQEADREGIQIDDIAYGLNGDDLNITFADTTTTTTSG